MTAANGAPNLLNKNVTVAFEPPTANFTHITSNLQATFTDTSTDGSGTIVSWAWYFGDGVSTSTLQNPSHTYATPGTYPVYLTVTDDNGVTNLINKNVTVTSGGT